MSNAQQVAYNSAVYRYDQMDWQVPMGNQASQQKLLDQPVLAWNDRFATEPAFLVDYLRRISDYMLLNPHPMWGSFNPNRPDLYSVLNGKLKQSDYTAIMRLFGDESAIPLKDSHFFHGAEKTLTAQIISQPFRWTTQNISTSFAEKSILEDAKKGAKLGVQALLAAMQANGDGGVAPLQDSRVKIPQVPEDWLEYATGQEQVEGIIWKLLKHIDLTHDFQNLAKDAVRHKFVVNAEFALVDVVNGEVVPKILHPFQVRWMAGKPVKTLQDPAVFGVQVNDYATAMELINMYGVGKMARGTGWKGALRYMEEFFEGKNKRLGYDPNQSYWSSRGISADTGYYCFDDQQKEYTTTQVNWMKNLFYPGQVNTKLMTNILHQKNYFTMLREKRFMVERVEVNGTRSNATDREYKNWQTNPASINYTIDFTPIGKETPNRANIKTYARPQLWEFTRIGHDGFIDYGPYKYQPDFDEDTQERNKISWPVVGRISHEKSMTLLGENDAQRVNILTQRMDMFLADLGYEEALIIDDIHGKDPQSYRYNAKQTGLLRITSTNFSPGNQAGLMHLKTVKLSNETEQIRFIWAQIMEIVRSYEVRVGAGPDVQGQTSEYASNKAQQQNIAGQQLLNVEFNLEHAQFMNQLLQTTADISKFHYGKDGQVLILLSERETEVLKLTYNLRLADFMVKLESGQVLADKKKLLDQLVGQLMQSGGIDQAEALMQIIMSDNPAEGVAKYRQVVGEIKKEAQAQQQSQQSIEQAKLADKQADRDHEVLLKQMDIDAEIRVASIKAGSDRASEEFKGVMSDIQTTTSREDQVLQSQLAQQEAAQQSQLDQQSQQQAQTQSA